LSYPDAWYIACQIAESLLKGAFLFCRLLPEFARVTHRFYPLGSLWVSYTLTGGLCARWTPFS